MTSRPSPSAVPSRRDRRREETTTDIKTTARAQLAAGGPTAISLRAIARQLGMTPTAVHYYFPGREALFVGGDFEGTRLTWKLRERVDDADVAADFHPPQRRVDQTFPTSGRAA